MCTPSGYKEIGQNSLWQKRNTFAAYQLDWEPSAAQVSHSNTRHLPALEPFSGKLNFLF